MAKSMAEYQRDHYRRRLSLAVDYLGGCCVRCGVTEDLEFDHIDRRNKSFTVSTGYKNKLDVFMAEVKKCQLLCHDCHLAKTKADYLANRKHGSHRMAYGKNHCDCDKCVAFRFTRSAIRRMKRRVNKVRTLGE